MAEPLATDITPQIRLADRVDAENTLEKNFDILVRLLKPGVSGSVTVGGHTFTFTNGILTGLT